MKHFSQKIVDLWYGPVRILWLLWPIELSYILFIKCRRTLYRLNLFSTYRAPCPVVVIGNLTAGGVGKTPVVIELVRTLQGLGYKVGVVSRGYGAMSSSKPVVVDRESMPSECGDEPILIYEKTECPVAVHRSRKMAAKLLIRKYAVDLIVSDDGLQHYALDRDLEIFLIDGNRGLGNKHCLPVGPLREPEKRLLEADIILRRGGDDSMSIRYIPGTWKKLGNSNNDVSEQFPMSSSVHAIAGIGQPEQFFSMLEDMGLTLKRFIYPDHYQFKQKDFDRHIGKIIVMTEKDAVKCRSLKISDAWFIEIGVSLPKEVIKRVVGLVEMDNVSEKLISSNEVA